MKHVIAAAAILALTAGTASAQYEDESGYMAGIGAGVTVPTGDLGDANSPGVSVSGFVSGPIAGMIGWRVQGAYDRFSTDGSLKEACDAFSADCSARIWNFGGGVQLTAHGGGSMVPYGYFTVGAYNAETSVDQQVADFFGLDFSSETELGIGFGGGVNWKAGDSWGVDFDVRINGIFPGDIEVAGVTIDRSTQWYIVPAGYLTFNF